MVYSENFAEIEQTLEPDQRMHALFQLIGNSIHPSIRLEVDYLSRHENGKLPILHLHVKVWIEKRRRVGDGGQDRAAMYKSCYMSSTTKMLPPNL